MRPSKTNLTSQPRSRVLTLAAIGFTSMTVLISGCSTSAVNRVGKSTEVTYYPSCYQPVQHLRDTDSNLTRSVATGAVLGAVGGALAGALTADKEDRKRNAAIGAAGGALVGGAAAYYTTKQQQISDDRQRIGSYSTDINASASTFDRSIAYAEASQSCYQNEFSNLLKQRKSGAVNEEEGRKRLAEIVSGLNESNNLITAVNGKAGEDLSNYTQAYEADLKNVGVARTEVATAAKTPAKKPAKVPAEAVKTEQVLQQAEAKKAKSQQVATAGTTKVNSMCSNPDMGDWAPIPCPV
ncbi:glycine zipper 2TM domain-containing protein [Ectopseudomonas mendocina]|uniref:type VI secretion system-associated lipoprotein TagQ n=1 Tax=Pseudomonas sp. zfem001 TaxID=3078196 RepID=UPI001179F79B|nr:MULTISPECIES: type VI secretion system-associated lipoprotein TagQ [Pseudomonas]MDU9408940.1 type VI secretion system-associated lipoprotein TagQ [Pseudomonas sp. zfem001]TRO21694.1 glycine zipper 2TM domain-containing protein [Pseudomonas mendocina]TRO27953.1 glycine zipper 2TM domain-containing protein [Pseudomonas mendocina]